MRKLDLDGHPGVTFGASRSGKLLALSVNKEVTAKRNYAYYDCLCDCGTVKPVRRNHFLNGKIRSCGCLHRETNGDAVRTHGRSGTRVYRIWKGVVRRCTKPNSMGYPDYGGRGIKVCDRWLASFVAFYEDVGDPPSAKHSIDRIDNDGNYEPGNTKWSTGVEQGRNKRNNVLVTYMGETLPLVAWSERTGIAWLTLHARIKRGWPAEKLFRPVGRPANAEMIEVRSMTQSEDNR